LPISIHDTYNLNLTLRLTEQVFYCLVKKGVFVGRDNYTYQYGSFL
jgi:hypothetical protein